MTEADGRSKTIQPSHIHAGSLHGFRLSTLHLVPASTKVHRARSAGLQGARSTIPPCCEHPFSSSTSGMAEVKEWNRDSYSQRQKKLNSTRHKHCQFLSKDKIIRKNCHKTSDWKQPLLYFLLQPTQLLYCLK